MGRGRGKGKKLSATSHDDPGSGEEEKIPAQKRRGRPQKLSKDEVEDEELVKVEEVVDEENKDSTAKENGSKRKRSSPSKEKQSPVKEENGVVPALVSEISTKPNGFRHIGSRRKNKPRRAAEVGVEC